MHQLIVTGYQTGFLAVLIGGQEFRHYVIDRDEQLIKRIVRAELDFWQGVLERRPPPASNIDDLLLHHRKALPASRQATPAVMSIFSEYAELRAKAKAIEEELNVRKFEICNFLGEHEELTDPNGASLATWKFGKPPARFDSKLHAVEQPHCHATYVAHGSP